MARPGASSDVIDVRGLRAGPGEAITASEAVGDDRLQRQARGEVDSDSFTHGSSEQRTEWFTRGRESGEPAACDTFSPESP